MRVKPTHPIVEAVALGSLLAAMLMFFGMRDQNILQVRHKATADSLATELALCREELDAQIGFQWTDSTFMGVAAGGDTTAWYPIVPR